MSYLVVIKHNFISENKLIMIAERQYNYYFLTISKEVEYLCEFKNRYNYEFYKNNKKVSFYEDFNLELYLLRNRCLYDTTKLKKELRLKKLKKLNVQNI